MHQFAMKGELDLNPICLFFTLTLVKSKFRQQKPMTQRVFALMHQ